MEKSPLEWQVVLRERPKTPWIMRQRWEQLLFLHWVWDEPDLQRRLPEGLKIQTFEGKAYLGLVPFFMRGVRPRGLPAMPGISNFLEMNLRTYVTDREGRPGVWFFSLDCDQPLAVWTARTFFHLAYHDADMAVTGSGEEGWKYECQRSGAGGATKLGYRLGPPGSSAVPGSLDFFLVERYLLFSATKKEGDISSGRVWHFPYVLSPAVHEGHTDAAFVAEGFVPPDRGPDHVVGSAGVDVWIHPLEAGRA